MEAQLDEVRHSNDSQSALQSESGSLGVSAPKATGDSVNSSDVTRKLEEELAKRDALIEVCLICHAIYICLQQFALSDGILCDQHPK